MCLVSSAFEPSGPKCPVLQLLPQLSLPQSTTFGTDSKLGAIEPKLYMSLESSREADVAYDAEKGRSDPIIFINLYRAVLRQLFVNLIY